MVGLESWPVGFEAKAQQGTRYAADPEEGPPLDHHSTDGPHPIPQNCQ